MLLDKTVYLLSRRGGYKFCKPFSVIQEVTLSCLLNWDLFAWLGSARWISVLPKVAKNVGQALYLKAQKGALE